MNMGKIIRIKQRQLKVMKKLFKLPWRVILINYKESQMKQYRLSTAWQWKSKSQENSLLFTCQVCSLIHFELSHHFALKLSSFLSPWLSVKVNAWIELAVEELGGNKYISSTIRFLALFDHQFQQSQMLSILIGFRSFIHQSIHLLMNVFPIELILL